MYVFPSPAKNESSVNVYMFSFPFIFTSLFQNLGQCVIWKKLLDEWVNDNYGSFYLWKKTA